MAANVIVMLLEDIDFSQIIKLCTAAIKFYPQQLAKFC